MNVLLKPAIISEWLLETLENTEEGIIFAQKKIIELENNLLLMDEILNKSLKLFTKTMKRNQQLIFIEAIKLLRKDTISLNRLSEILSEKLDFTFSMIKWNLTKLREHGLFRTNGQRGNTKSTLIITEFGERLYLSFAEKNNRKL